MDERLGVFFLFVVTFNFVFALPRLDSGRANNEKGNVKNNLFSQELESGPKVMGDEHANSGVKNGSNEDLESGYDGSDEPNDNEEDVIDSGESGEHAISNEDDNDPKSQDDEYSSVRSLRSGDTFTPQELLPIAKKFIEKVDNHTKGKGIVSKARSAESLADTLFQAFFTTTKRIVILDDSDLSGLDALQGLALDGDVVDRRTEVINSYTERPSEKFDLLAESLIHRREPGKCRYKLITKNIEKNDNTKTKGMVVNNPSKKRPLLVNTRRSWKKGNSARESVEKGKRKNRMHPHSVNKAQTKETDPKYDCHWKFECKDPMKIDTCGLRVVCPQNNSRPLIYPDDNLMNNKEEEDHISMSKLREILGICVLDEEVEKLIKIHHLQKRPELFEENGHNLIQTLEEYFNGILIMQHSRTTTPIAPLLAVQENTTPKDIESLKGEEVLIKVNEDHTPISTQIRGESRVQFPATTPMTKIITTTTE